MRPDIIELFGKIPIHGYGLMIVTGFLIQLWVGGREVRRRGLPEVFSDLAICVLLSGILGGRIFYYLQFYEKQFAEESFLAFFKIWEGGLVFYGGAVGGLLGGLGFLLWKRLPVREFMDVVAFVAPIGMGFGRLGCFLQGCCFGRRCAADFPLGVSFPPDSPAAVDQIRHGWLEVGAASLPVHPVQLYQAGHDFLLFGLLWIFLRHANPPKGAGIPFLITLYGIGRFALEGLRADNAITWTGLTISQNVSLLLVAVFGATLLALYARTIRSGRRLAGA